MEKNYEFRPKILGFLCNWCCYAGADLCGISRYQYPPNMKVIRLMCSGRVDPLFIFRSFLNGMDGVFIGGCWPGECHYITEGNYLAISMIQVCKKLMALIGINPDRLRLEWVSASEGVRYADQIIDKYMGNPGALIHVLMEVQGENQWLPKEILTLIAEKLDVPLRRVMQIASFYKTFRLTPKGRHEIHVCNGTACHLRGSDLLLASVQETIGIRPGEMAADSKFSLETGNCLGCCTLGPEMIIDGAHHARISPDNAQDFLKDYA